MPFARYLSWLELRVSVFLADISRYGPNQTEKVSLDAARAYCRKLARGHYENFSVLSPLVPVSRRDDFAAVYAFARWADDLGDEAGSTDRATELLGWWRGELNRLVAGEAQHPVFLALQATIHARGLALTPFTDLIAAFELDQVKTRSATWDELKDYCRVSANPVGRLVLALLGESQSAEQLAASDAVCTALQLTNHWQDVRRDLLERDRVYLPRDAWRHIPDFESRLLITARRGWAADLDFLPAYRDMLAKLCDSTEQLFDRGDALLPKISTTSRPVIALFSAGGRGVLNHIRQWDFETCIRRPKMGRVEKLFLVSKAWLSSRMNRNAA